MKNHISNLKTAVNNFHNNESGANAMEVIMLLAIAAIVGVAVYQFGGRAVGWCKDKLDAIINGSDNYQTGSSNGGSI